MHNVFRLSDKRSRVVDHLPTEIEAVAAARFVAAKIVEIGKEREQGRGHLLKQLDIVSRAGLLGISVPSEYGGADITNAVLAEIVSLLSESDVRIGESVESHFQVLECIRLFASDGQKAVYFSHALSGEQFALVSSVDDHPETVSASPNLHPDRTGFRLTALTVALNGGFCDWIAVPAIDPKGGAVLALLARDGDELTFRQTHGDLHGVGVASLLLDLSDIHIPADSLLSIDHGSDAASTLSSLGTLLTGAVDLGVARAYFSAIGQCVAKTGHVEGDVFVMVGRLSARVDGAAAMIERAGQNLDVAQVHPTPDSVLQASLAANAAVVLAEDVAIEARAKFVDRAESVDHQLHASQRREAITELGRKVSIALGQFHTLGKAPAAWPFG
ncbi:acyl-CoA dehydrogenase family protein [Rhizobium sp.]|jgi:alkylation response protein AidB-like acyl-CoA dehydrogenase|uniref:acyl-CoA dehydrogenase family protein n=1 Tax=Rhizobium sp. TaxID=391 RepID=UPI002AA618B0